MVDFLLEGESECTSERARGQFSIFGAVEENCCHGFSRMGTDRGSCGRCAAKPRVGLGFCLRDSVGKKILESGGVDCAQGLHRKCRKQWSGVRGQRPVETSAWLRLAGQPRRLPLHGCDAATLRIKIKSRRARAPALHELLSDLPGLVLGLICRSCRLRSGRLLRPS